MRPANHGTFDGKRRPLPNFKLMSHPALILFPMDLTKISYKEYVELYNNYKTKAFQNRLENISTQMRYYVIT